MVPEDLFVWLEACDPATLGDDRPGLLCRRHADAMVVPVGWTLDDRREAVPRLFKVRDAAPVAPRPSGDHTGRLRRPKIRQESLLDLVAPDAGAVVAAPEPAAPPAEPEPERSPGPGPAPDAEPVEGAPPSWSPRFDRSDDLGGLLAPRGKLLRRAFGAEPPR